jgi:hypothetical protein
MFALLAGKSFAQQTTDQVTLNVNLHKFQSIVVNGNKTVDINFTNKNDYANGSRSATQQNHLTVSSTGAFVVRVGTAVGASNNTTNSTGKQMGADQLKVQASESSTNPVTDAQYQNAVNISNTAEIFRSNKGQFDRNVDVVYIAEQDFFKNSNLINNGFLDNNLAVTTYKVDLTYTITTN